MLLPSLDRNGLARPSVEPITTLESLREHLQWALELEHCTMPPYLCGLYSLDAEGNGEAAEVMMSVLLEEMLHLALVANLLNAIGGRPTLDPRRLMRPYPRGLPHGDETLQLTLQRFSPQALELYLRIERPAPVDAPAESDRYETIGQFYAAIERSLRSLSAELGESAVFRGTPSRQVGAPYFYGSGGRLIVVDSLQTALAALAEIVEQGEGVAHHEVWDRDRDLFHTGRRQVAHYYRFQQLKHGRRYRPGDTPDSGPTGEPLVVDWSAVRPMQVNPRMSDHPPGSFARLAQEGFNRTYAGLLSLLELAFDGSPETLHSAISVMGRLKTQAQEVMATSIGGGETAGPTFEYVAPE
jgi:hypothetical protein